MEKFFLMNENMIVVGFVFAFELCLNCLPIRFCEKEVNCNHPFFPTKSCMGKTSQVILD